MSPIDYSGQVELPAGVNRVRCRHGLKKYGMFNFRFDGKHNGRRLSVEQAGTGYVEAWNMTCEKFTEEMKRVDEKYGPVTESTQPS